MLSKILTKTTCSKCKFCCSFRRESLWELPSFSIKEKTILEEKYSVKFIPYENDSYVFDLISSYKKDDPSEEVKCPFLNTDKGCILNDDEKPFECKVWPFRVMKDDDENIYLTLCTSCPSSKDFENFEAKKIIESEIKPKILEKCKFSKSMIKNMHNNYKKYI